MLKEKKKLHIVCDQNTLSYGNYLRQLISSGDTEQLTGIREGMLEAVVWAENEYIKNRSSFSSSQYMLFIGNGKAAKSEKVNIPMVFDQFGMQYGWLGKIAVLCASYNGIFSWFHDAKTSEFLAFCKKYRSKYPDKIMIRAISSLSSIGNPLLSSPSLSFGTDILNLFLLPDSPHKIMSDQQYICLVYVFYTTALAKFLEA